MPLKLLCVDAVYVVQVEKRRDSARRAADARGCRLIPGKWRCTESRSGSAVPNAKRHAWENTLSVSTDADIALKWLEVQMQPPDEQIRVRRAEFVIVFPGEH